MSFSEPLASAAILQRNAQREIDQLVPDTVVCKEFGITAMSLWRWDRDPALDFPPQIKIRTKNCRSRKQLEEFKARLLRSAIEKRAHKQERRA
jgi:hypothetical protein